MIGRCHGLDDPPDVLRAGQPRRVQDVGAGALIGLEPRDRVVEVGAAVQIVLGARGQHQLHRPAVRDLDGRRDSLGRVPELIDRVVAIAREVLDRAARKPCRERPIDRFRDPPRIIGKRVLEIGRDRQVGRPDDRGGVLERLRAADRSVEPAECGRMTTARRRERLEPE